MKFVLNMFLLLFFSTIKSQTLLKNNSVQDFKSCNNKSCKIKAAFLNAEYYLDNDDIFSSQKWLDVTKNLSLSKKIDTTTIFINSLQSELFYYNGLFQFGINESEKAIKNAL